MAANRPKYDAFVVKEGKDGKDIWNKIGVAFEAKNNSLVIELHAHPIGSRVVLRPHKPPRDDDDARKGSTKATPSRLPRPA